MDIGGQGKYNEPNKKYNKIYKKWQGVLQRCYDNKFLERNPSYVGCSAVKEWHNFQVFAKWYEENWKDYMDSSWHLDKDILIKGNKIYSPETCAFVPHEINGLILKGEKSRGDLPIGVCAHGNKFVVQLSTNSKNPYLTTRDTPEEAFYAYKIAKEIHIKEVAEIWKPLITPEVYNALINYQVEITD